MKKRIKINFYGFWEGFDYEDFFIYQILNSKYEVEISDNPDYSIISCFDYEYNFLQKCKGIRIFYTGENVPPDFSVYDYAIGFDRISFGDRFFRYPLSYSDVYIGKLAETKHENIEKILTCKDLFCTFMYSHEGCKERTEIFNAVSSYKRVDSVGKYLRNSDIQIPYDSDNHNKLLFQGRAKFVLAIENTSYPGYSTEKLLHAFASRTVPIYYGDPSITDDFNQDAFINVHAFKSYDQLIAFIREVDQNDEQYLKMLHAPAFKKENFIFAEREKVMRFLFNIFDQEYHSAFRRPRDGIVVDREKVLSEVVFYKKGYLNHQNKSIANRIRRKVFHK